MIPTKRKHTSDGEPDDAFVLPRLHNFVNVASFLQDPNLIRDSLQPMLQGDALSVAIASLWFGGYPNMAFTEISIPDIVLPVWQSKIKDDRIVSFESYPIRRICRAPELSSLNADLLQKLRGRLSNAVKLVHGDALNLAVVGCLNHLLETVAAPVVLRIEKVITVNEAPQTMIILGSGGAQDPYKLRECVHSLIYTCPLEDKSYHDPRSFTLKHAVYTLRNILDSQPHRQSAMCLVTTVTTNLVLQLTIDMDARYEEIVTVHQCRHLLHGLEFLFYHDIFPATQWPQPSHLPIEWRTAEWKHSTRNSTVWSVASGSAAAKFLHESREDWNEIQVMQKFKHDTSELLPHILFCSTSHERSFFIMSPLGECLPELDTGTDPHGIQHTWMPRDVEWNPVFNDILDALDRLHKTYKLAHNNVKLTNVLVVKRDGRARGVLIDFDQAGPLESVSVDLGAYVDMAADWLCCHKYCYDTRYMYNDDEHSSDTYAQTWEDLSRNHKCVLSSILWIDEHLAAMEGDVELVRELVAARLVALSRLHHDSGCNIPSIGCLKRMAQVE
ncbi:hypothetical protein EDC01DRAFT_731805 [Geopyxis carbonaria]|nr:hypothetical protein EDC01DRAFT_731805 [Geopyxis carbonaria]